MLKVGDKLPATQLQEFIEVEGNGCSIGPNGFAVADLVAGKTIAIFGLPGAYTPTCSAQHLPSYVEKAAELKAAGVDEIWCVSVNDAFVMGAWGRADGSDDVTMLGDGNGDFAQALGLTMDGSGFGLGQRGSRWSMVVNDGTVEQLNVEGPGEYKVSSAEHMLEQL